MHLQYVSEVVIGAPYAVGKDLLDHFKVSCKCVAPPGGLRCVKHAEVVNHYHFKNVYRNQFDSLVCDH